MKTSTENSSENPLERVADKDEVSVYSVNFTQSVNNHNAEKEITLKPLKKEALEEKKPLSGLSGKIFKRRNAIGIAAILAVGILHFAFQISFIQTEKTQVAEAPAKIEQIQPQTVETKPAEFEATKVDIVLPEKSASQIRQQKREIAPAKPPLLKKKDAAPAKTERLRRAEKILTGI